MFQPPHSLITPAPMVHRRAAGGENIGYYPDGTTWDLKTCRYPAGLSISGNFFSCVGTDASSDIPFPTTCVDGSVLVFADGSPTTSLNCNGPCCSEALLSDDKDTLPVMGYSCPTLNCIPTMYFTTFSITSSTQTTESSSISTKSPNSSKSSDSSTSPSSTPNTSPLNNADSSDSSTSTSRTSAPPTQPATNLTNHHSSQTWIAGAVIAPVVAIAIILGLAFWVWKLKRSQKTPQNQPAGGDGYNGPADKSELPPNHIVGAQGAGLQNRAVQNPGVQGFETRGPERAELSRGHEVLEAPNTGFVSELPGYSTGYGGR